MISSVLPLFLSTDLSFRDFKTSLKKRFSFDPISIGKRMHA
ncbi:hypothetical protein LEP1GSC132_0342 [Leptospira kirschneri str. 200803703]|uniref:Uncharacterized protein n=1 Tax=Leptospira kirschneri str. 200802841 TaxID=1193047 RepID=A0A828Y023_9LEPT|nr:hypothetical protein LEP1GSC131_0427 [Leptospira kirschneri str. 200802841]EMN24292.1 hypothetical protein LEP1GSC065_1573 [Leptospira kirschneri serovar Sokoine str. RM1]EMO68647.1 hypothetical protein LEP1GSC132_0342 [Leptospira kirschneri str. 200803703]EMO74818.1 hypothetical protein LEP1GSC127_1124 [Leptospira kirschneri str. 200801925]